MISNNCQMFRNLTACNYSYIQLIDFNARFYSPRLGRFIQPDSVIPDLTNPQSLNRFSYVLNSPLVFIDPSGHMYLSEPGWNEAVAYTQKRELVNFVANEGQDWTEKEKEAIRVGASETANALFETLNSVVDPQNVKFSSEDMYIDFSPHFGTSADAFLYVYGGSITAKRSDDVRDYAAEITGKNEITYYNVQYYREVENEKGNIIRIPYRVEYAYTAAHIGHTIHELGHLFDNRTGNHCRGQMTGALTVDANNIYEGFPGTFEVGRYSKSTTSTEVFADMFYVWIYKGNVFGTNQTAVARQNHMRANMLTYIFMAAAGP